MRPWAWMLLLSLLPLPARAAAGGGANAAATLVEPAAAALAATCGQAIRDVLAQGPWAREDSLDFAWELPPLLGLPAQAEVEARPLLLRPRGTSTVGLTICERGLVLRRLTVPVRVRRWERLPVAKRDLARGRVLAAEDLEERWLETTRLADDDLPRLADVLGRRLTRFLLAGRAIANRQLDDEPDIRRGEPLTLTVVSGGVTVSAAAEALEDGRVGHVLRVRLGENGRRFSARLTERGRAVVEVAG